MRWLLIALLWLAVDTSAQVRTEAVTLGGREVQVDVYTPAAPTRDLAIIAHGFTRSRAQHQELASALAARGVTVVVPDLPYVMDLWGNADAIVELEHHLEAGGIGLAPRSRKHVALLGVSAGGLSTVIAASNLPGIAGWVGLDPVDRTGSGVAAAENMRSPAIVLLAEPSLCNLGGSGDLMARAAPALIRATQIHGAGHCDFEGPTNAVCTSFCGWSWAEMRTAVRNAAVTATIELLRGS